MWCDVLWCDVMCCVDVCVCEYVTLCGCGCAYKYVDVKMWIWVGMVLSISNRSSSSFDMMLSFHQAQCSLLFFSSLLSSLFFFLFSHFSFLISHFSFLLFSFVKLSNNSYFSKKWTIQEASGRNRTKKENHRKWSLYRCPLQPQAPLFLPLFSPLSFLSSLLFLLSSLFSLNLRAIWFWWLL